MTNVLSSFTISALKCVSFASGVIITYAAVFLREDEESNIQNILESWWIRLDDIERTARGRRAVFSRKLVLFASKFLAALFGKRIVSFRAAGASACLSMAGLLAVYGVDNPKTAIQAFVRFGDSPPSSHNFYVAKYLTIPCLLARVAVAHVLGTGGYSMAALLIGAVAFACIVLQIFWPRTAALMLFFAGAVPIALWLAYISPVTSIILPPYTLLGALAVGIACNVLVVAATRQSLLRLHNATSVLLAGGFHVALLVATIQVPLRIMIRLLTVSGSPEHHVAYMFGLAAVTNLFSGLVCLVLLFSAAILILDTLIWPSFSRPLYTLARLRVLSTPASRAALFTVGVAAMSVGVGKGGSMFDALLHVLGSG